MSRGVDKRVELTPGEVELIRDGLVLKVKSIMRKRSWRPSEKAMAVTDVRELAKKLGVKVFKDQERSENRIFIEGR